MYLFVLQHKPYITVYLVLAALACPCFHSVCSFLSMCHFVHCNSLSVYKFSHIQGLEPGFPEHPETDLLGNGLFANHTFGNFTIVNFVHSFTFVFTRLISAFANSWKQHVTIYIIFMLHANYYFKFFFSVYMYGT